MITKIRQLYFFLTIVSEVSVWKNPKQTLSAVEKVTVQKLVIGFRTVTSNHRVVGLKVKTFSYSKYIMWDGFYYKD